MYSIEILEKADIFADLTREQLETIFAICQPVVCYQDELIFAENTSSTDFYVVMEGEVVIEVDLDLVIHAVNPHLPAPINTMRAGQSFGEVALVDQGIRSASARCHSMLCHLVKINREDLLALIEKDPRMGVTIMTNLARDLCLKIRLSTLNLRQGINRLKKNDPKQAKKSNQQDKEKE